MIQHENDPDKGDPQLVQFENQPFLQEILSGPPIQAFLSNTKQRDRDKFMRDGIELTYQPRLRALVMDNVCTLGLSSDIFISPSRLQRCRSDRKATQKMDGSTITLLLDIQNVTTRPSRAAPSLEFASACRRAAAKMSHCRRHGNQRREMLDIAIQGAVLFETICNYPRLWKLFTRVMTRYATPQTLLKVDDVDFADAGRVANQCFDEIDLKSSDPVPENGLLVAEMLSDVWNLHAELLIVREGMAAAGYAYDGFRSVLPSAVRNRLVVPWK